MTNSNDGSHEARLTPAERDREREDPEISPAQPLGPGRIDDDNGKLNARSGKPHVKSDDDHRMKN